MHKDIRSCSAIRQGQPHLPNIAVRTPYALHSELIRFLVHQVSPCTGPPSSERHSSSLSLSLSPLPSPLSPLSLSPLLFLLHGCAVRPGSRPLYNYSFSDCCLLLPCSAHCKKKLISIFVSGPADSGSATRRTQKAWVFAKEHLTASTSRTQRRSEMSVSQHGNATMAHLRFYFHGPKAWPLIRECFWHRSTW